MQDTGGGWRMNKQQGWGWRDFGGKTETDLESHLLQTDGESESDTADLQCLNHTHMLIHEH